MCSENHLSLLANAAATDKAGKDAAFKLLIAENIRSLNHRYPGDEDWDDASEMVRREAPASELVEQALKARPARSVWNFDGALSAKALATQIVKCCDCYDYQACETDDYERSEAKALVEKIRAQAIEIGGESSGSKLYDAMVWGLY
jgi:hypothetical protein